MKKTIGLLVIACLILPAMWLSGNAQQQGGETYVELLQRRLKECKQGVSDAELRIKNLRILLDAYLLIPDMTDAQINRWDDLLKEDVYLRMVTYERLCWDVTRYERDLQEFGPKPTPTPTPRIGPVVIQPPTRTPSPTPTPTATPSKEQEEVRKRLKEIIDGMDPLTAEINDWVKKRKAKLPPVKAPDGLETDKRWQPGIQTVSFDLPQGSIVVNLPDNMQAGDTISGTVMVESKGSTETEQNQNSTALQHFAIELNMPDTTIVRVALSTIRNNFAFVMRSDPGTGTVGCNLVTRSGADVANVKVPISPTPPVTPNATTPRPAKFQFPSLVQQGRALEIIGPFDGSFKTTEVEIGGQPARVLAESRNSCVVQSPDQTFGPTEISVKEGNVETKGTYRNLGLRLAAPKTSLLKSETTVLTVTVEGLKGIQQNVPLLLQKQGVVSMAGGDTQTVQIRRVDVRADGTFETKRTLTGLQAGSFGVTATVIDPAHRPIIIPLTENAKVNGFRVRKDGDKLVIEVEGVQSPITGKPVDGEQKLEHQCPTLSKVPYINRLFLNKGMGKMKAECLIMITPRIIVQDED